MIIKSSRNNSKFVPKEQKIEKTIKEEVKPIVNDNIYKKKNNKKNIPTPVIEEENSVVEENIDLSEWLKEDSE